jgi:hypothetical protein
VGGIAACHHYFTLILSIKRSGMMTHRWAISHQEKTCRNRLFGMIHCNFAQPGVATIVLATLFQMPTLPTASGNTIWVVAANSSDVLEMLAKSSLGASVIRARTAEEAATKAAVGDGVMLLVNGYPSNTTAVPAAILAATAAKKLRLFVEYPVCSADE